MMTGPPRHRRSSRPRWSLPINRRSAILGGGIGLILLVALAVPLALNAGRPALATPAPSAVAAAGTSRPSPASSLAGGSATPSPSALTQPVAATRIEIAGVGIDLPVVEGDGVDAPLYKVAHYPGTAWPGGGSNIYLYAHAQKGMFLSLWKVKLGDTVVLGLADGSQRTYVVTQVLPDVAWNDMALLAPTPDEQLTLQTCTSYEQTAPRFVVIAVPQT